MTSIATAARRCGKCRSSGYARWHHVLNPIRSPRNPMDPDSSAREPPAPLLARPAHIRGQGEHDFFLVSVCRAPPTSPARWVRGMAAALPPSSTARRFTSTWRSWPILACCGDFYIAGDPGGTIQAYRMWEGLCTSELQGGFGTTRIPAFSPASVFRLMYCAALTCLNSCPSSTTGLVCLGLPSCLATSRGGSLRVVRPGSSVISSSYVLCQAFRCRMGWPIQK